MILWSGVHKRRETGHAESKVIPGHPNVKGAALQAHLLAQFQAHPDLRRQEHCRLFKEAHGIQVSPASITRARQAQGFPRKKVG